MHSKKYFDAVAGQWDAMRAGFFSESVRMKAFAVAGLQTGQVAADLGAGTGFITEGLIREGLHVIAVDQSEAMLAQMQKKLQPPLRKCIVFSSRVEWSSSLTWMNTPWNFCVPNKTITGWDSHGRIS